MPTRPPIGTLTPAHGATPQATAALQHNRGLAFAQLGRNTQAIECFRAAIGIDPYLFAAYANLGALLSEQGAVDEALTALRRAMELRPDNAAVHNNLSNLLAALGQLDAAEAHSRRSLAIRPDNAEALNALGNVLKDKGMLDEAIDAYGRAALLRPDLPQPTSNYLYALHFQPKQNSASLLAAHREWADRFAAPFRSSWAPHPNDRDPARRLKIGYVSPDFREHPVGRFILPLLAQHDRANVEVFCYANMRATDSMSDLIRARADVWRDIAPLSDEQACEMIRADEIDILVDLTMHMRSNRLFVFARKPAPVQVTYLAYCSTTGMDAIDYRLTDAFLDPPADDDVYDHLYVERSVRLPNTYWCYQPCSVAPEVSPPPAVANGHLTFSCLNNFCKVTPATLAAWARVLAAIPSARLVLHAGEGKFREHVREILGVDETRVRFVGRVSMAEYFAHYHQIDIALDPFPCTGGTTTCDALWMGVPVVTLAGDTAVARGGLSILSNIGRGEWVAGTIDEYVNIAVALAGDGHRLAMIRGSLRDEMARSPLMDAHRFATEIEMAYRRMWRNWCENNPRGAGG
jgi:protein O-GlcNAc transferase